QMDEMVEKLRSKQTKAEQKQDNYKLYLGIGCGVLGVKLNNNPKLIELTCRDNQLTSLNLSNYPNLETINCAYNQLTNLNFLNNLNEEKLTYLNVRDNNITSDLTPFSKFVNLEGLYLNNNNFFGSLKPLGGLDKLNWLDIRDTDINSGLEYLPDNVEYFYCSADERKDAKCKDIYNLFANDQGEVEIE
ncbi:18724_t:CDS:2, partial [Funneliformis geosporum]